MTAEPTQVYEFGPFRLDARARLLTRDGEPVALTPKALETLVALVESGGVVSRDELIRKVWPDTFVEENNLSVNVSMLRKALGTGPDGKHYIETLPRRGYRFTAEVRTASGNGHEVTVERRSKEQIVVIEEDDHVEPGLPALTRLEGLSSARRPVRGRVALIVAAVLFAGALGLALYAWRAGDRQRPAPPRAIRSLAVLPFKPLGAAGQGDNYLGVGIADALITKLGGLDQVRVRPTSAVLRFDDTNQDSLVAARALGVDAVLEGSYQLTGERVRVTVQLVSASDGAQLWSGTFDDEFVNIFAVQDSISRQVTQALTSDLDEAERRSLARRATENVEAYQLYLKGRYLWAKKANLDKARQYFEQAVQLDPQYARAYSGLADCYLALSEFSLLPRAEAYAKAVAAAQQAVSLDPALAEAHTTLGFIHLSQDWDYPGAEREFKRAIELDPDDATARQFYGVYLLAVGQREAAIAETRRALELDPLSILNNTQLGRALYLAGRYDEAIEQSLKTIELDPTSASAYVYLGQSHAHKGMLREATAELEKAVELSDGRVEMKAALGYAYALSGRKDEARKIIDELTTLGNDLSSASYHIATIYAGFPEKEQAIARLQGAYEERDIFLGVRLKTDPKLDGLRSDPRFQDLVRRVGLPQ